MRSIISRAFSRTITSDAWRTSQRALRGIPRRIGGNGPIVHYFHEDEDPYSRLLAAALPSIIDRYRIDLHCHRVTAPDTAAAPDKLRLRDWAERDAARLARHFAIRASDSLPSSLHFSALAPAHGANLRRKLGHYQSATLYFEGEWYWGIDRLHYLEKRLQQAGLDRDPGRELLIAPPALRLSTRPSTAGKLTLDFFCSLRSPYTYLAAERARHLADHYQLELRLRYLLPMVMRGLPVPFAKRKYILLDSKREADRLEMPFGDVADPVGSPVENGLAILHAAISLGSGSAFLEAFLRGVFAEGRDAGRRTTLQSFAAQAGLDAQMVESALENVEWRTIAALNREQLLDQGLWGVPSFQLSGHQAVWGQDRLWMIEQDLLGETNK